MVLEYFLKLAYVVRLYKISITQILYIFSFIFWFKSGKIIVHWTVKIFTSVLSIVSNHKYYSNPSYPWFSPIFKSTLDKLNVRFSWTYLLSYLKIGFLERKPPYLLILSIIFFSVTLQYFNSHIYLDRKKISWNSEWCLKSL